MNSPLISTRFIIHHSSPLGWRRRMRIAWFTPFSPHSAIGHYSQAIVEELAKADEVVVFASDEPRPSGRGGRASSDSATAPTPHCSASWTASTWLVYNMGDHSIYHKKIYEILLQRPGVVVLHDLVMRNFFNGYHLQERHDPLGPGPPPRLQRRPGGDGDGSGRRRAGLTPSHGRPAPPPLPDVQVGPAPLPWGRRPLGIQPRPRRRRRRRPGRRSWISRCSARPPSAPGARPGRRVRHAFAS